MAEMYERIMARVEQIMRAGYQVKVLWKYEFQNSILDRHTELQIHPIVEHSPLNTQDALYGGRTEAMLLH